MASHRQSSTSDSLWNEEARRLVIQARVLSGEKLLQLVARLQRMSGHSRDACWRFILHHGLKSDQEHRRWSENEFAELREELKKHSVAVAARKLHRTPGAIRSILARNGLSVRSIRCDILSVESVSLALHVGRNEILRWINEGWLEASTEVRGKRHFYSITPDGFAKLYRHHLDKLTRRGVANRTLFEAYLQYCYAPKHSTGTQLLDVRRDKKEREEYDKQGTLPAADIDDREDREFTPQLTDAK